MVGKVKCMCICWGSGLGIGGVNESAMRGGGDDFLVIYSDDFLQWHFDNDNGKT